MAASGGDSAAAPNVVQSIAAAAAGALAEFGFRPHALELVSHYVNTVFRLTTESGSYVVRVHRAAGRTAREVAGELAWLDALARAENLRVPRVRRTPDGQGIVLVSTPEDRRKLPVTVLDWMSGRTIGAEKETHDFEKLGRMTAALHRHARAWRPTSKLDRPTYDSSNVFRADVPARIAEALGAARAPPVNAALSTLEGRLQKTEEQLGTGADVFGFIHGDLSFGNVLFDKERAFPSTSTTVDSAITSMILQFHSRVRSDSARVSKRDTMRSSQATARSLDCRVTCSRMCRSFSACDPHN